MDFSGILQARILEWVAIPFSWGSFWPRDRTQVSCIAGRFFIVWATGEAHWNQGLRIILVPWNDSPLLLALLSSSWFCFLGPSLYLLMDFFLLQGDLNSLLPAHSRLERSKDVFVFCTLKIHSISINHSQFSFGLFLSFFFNQIGPFYLGLRVMMLWGSIYI